ncbi:hypothetical protein INR49_004967 [Caranx melampygus]|nr:hypothetical protein INR49_004967 [Caranx melampygus]
MSYLPINLALSRGQTGRGGHDGGRLGVVVVVVKGKQKTRREEQTGGVMNHKGVFVRRGRRLIGLPEPDVLSDESSPGRSAVGGGLCRSPPCTSDTAVPRCCADSRTRLRCAGLTHATPTSRNGSSERVRCTYTLWAVSSYLSPYVQKRGTGMIHCRCTSAHLSTYVNLRSEGSDCVWAQRQSGSSNKTRYKSDGEQTGGRSCDPMRRQ